ncbi:MAG: SUMF1/EgtB/PvdO family nonheme iron enzyme [Phycisphaerae bacterium]|jgi:formylglycine-generating enzyme required for sulfatase activity|nr:SUMF1/EgtB/PvdO family nonheme iron enzyme [Phycisphaerae bacterium]
MNTIDRSPLFVRLLCLQILVVLGVCVSPACARDRKKAPAAVSPIGRVNLPALRRTIVDLSATYPKRYPRGKEFLAKVDAYLKAEATEKTDELLAFQQTVLRANPLLDFKRLMVVKRRLNRDLGLPCNHQGNAVLDRAPLKGKYDNEIAVMSQIASGGKLTTLYRPKTPRYVGHVDLHFDADRLLFSMPGANERWQIWEIKINGSGLRQVTEGKFPDVDSYDACYLPDGRIIFASTCGFQGVPCVTSQDEVANLCIMNADGTKTRRLTFDQDHSWHPSILNDGRVLFTRWEYTDSSHYFSRIVMTMNPDGTAQRAYYGSNSYWPNSTFFARAIPGDATKFVGVVSGHHGSKRAGEMVVFDPARGTFEADGVVKRIGDFGKKVEPVIADRLVDKSWPKFLHPYPLSDKYFLAAVQPSPKDTWGIYLVDIHDNMLLLKEEPGWVLFEPVPIRKTPKPPVIPDRVNLASKNAVLDISDIYVGQGLKGVPRGTVKNLRVFSYEYAYRLAGRSHAAIGLEGPWDVHKIHGTVSVNADGSVRFIIPANTPISLQPLDAEGKALQLMRSWLTAMPGEVLACVGCHEKSNQTPPPRMTMASAKPPLKITPWRGRARGFSFKREVQPVLDKYCVGCHDGVERKGRTIPDFATKSKRGFNGYTPSYIALHPYVRRNGPEGDYHVLTPLEFHADTSELVQMLQQGHHNVRLDAEAWGRLVTWIDLNVPDHGTWSEYRPVKSNFAKRRREMQKLYASIDDDPERILKTYPTPVKFLKPRITVKQGTKPITIEGWPFDAKGAPTKRTIDLGDGVKMTLVRIPAGRFVMGPAKGENRRAARVDRPFWMGATEVTLQQYRRFDPSHENGYYDRHNKDQVDRGWFVGEPDMPVIRISHDQAAKFCVWLAKKTKMKIALPTETQWEWACRAGSDASHWYGKEDFSTFANLADASISKLCWRIEMSKKYQDFIPRDERFNDGVHTLAKAGAYKPNPWGLHDMHGNAAEWTATTDNGRMIIRGGSWRDRPARATSAFRLAFPKWQKVYNVGFRIVCEDSRPD